MHTTAMHKYVSFSLPSSIFEKEDVAIALVTRAEVEVSVAVIW